MEARQRNHISRRSKVRRRRVSAAELAHSLDAGGRQGEWRSEAACEAPRPLGHRTLAPGRGGSGVGEKGRTRGPYHPLSMVDPWTRRAESERRQILGPRYRRMMTMTHGSREARARTRRATRDADGPRPSPAGEPPRLGTLTIRNGPQCGWACPYTRTPPRAFR